MMFSSDIAGASCEAIEGLIGGVALFVNADAGDIDPTSATCGCSQVMKNIYIHIRSIRYRTSISIFDRLYIVLYCNPYVSYQYREVATLPEPRKLLQLVI